MNWYYAAQGQEQGPISEANLDEMFRNGTISADTLVWQDGMAGWEPYQTARGGSVPPPMEEGVSLPTGELACAPNGARVGARLLDGIIFFAFYVVVSFLMGVFVAIAGSRAVVLLLPLLMLFIVVPAAIFYGTFMVGKYGGTLGKLAMKIKVVNADGSPASYGRAFGRYFARLLSGMICLIGFIMAFFDDEKRALHDRICNTRVVKK